MYRRLTKTLSRYAFAAASGDRRDIKLHYGCGAVRQNGYVNVDLRWTPAVDFVADLRWCARWLEGRCAEVYLSHVLEHFEAPGRNMRETPETVLGALISIRSALAPDGIVRLAVPDFGVLATLYAGRRLPLHPKLIGRVCGEQDYRENVHRCVFDRAFLESCLLRTGYRDIREWDPGRAGLARDSSSDEVDGVPCSLNLMASCPRP